MTYTIIVELKNSQLYAECTCGEFTLSAAILFDGSKPFPTETTTIQETMKTELQERGEELKQSIKNATKKAQVTTKAVNIGKNLEKILPTMADFKWVVPDSRFLGDPIDLMTFNGLSQNNVDSISFIEVKSGNAKLNSHQKSIRDAIEDFNSSLLEKSVEDVGSITTSGWYPLNQRLKTLIQKKLSQR